MNTKTDELEHELDHHPKSVLRSDYCPECGRVGCCGGEQDCAARRRTLERELSGARAHLRELERWTRDVQLELAFRRMSIAAAELIRRGECDA